MLSLSRNYYNYNYIIIMTEITFISHISVYKSAILNTEKFSLVVG